MKGGKSGRGISLIEILAAVAVFTILLAISTQVILTTLRGSDKSKVTTRVKESANYASSIMERLLHSSIGVVDCQPQRVTYLDSNGQPSTLSCENVGDGGYVASNSGRITNEDVAVTFCDFNCAEESGVTTSVNVIMTFRQATPSSLLRAEERADFQLSTKILLRN